MALSIPLPDVAKIPDFSISELISACVFFFIPRLLPNFLDSSMTEIMNELSLAFISEMLTAKFEKSWLETGALRVRFKGAAYVGDTVEAIGRVDKDEPDLQDLNMRRLGCAVGVKNQQNGQELISGTATLLV